MEDIKNKILCIVKNNPKQYSRLIKQDTVLSTWVTQNTLLWSDVYAEMIYSAVYKINPICSNKVLKNFKSFSVGYRGCGPATTCSCTRNKISNSMITYRMDVTGEQQEIINSKRLLTMIEKNNHGYSFNNPETYAKICAPKIPNSVYEKLNSFEWLDIEYNTKKRSAVDIATDFNIHYSTVLSYCRAHGFVVRPNSLYSKEEISIKNYIESTGVTVIHGDRTLLDNKEIDLYFPDYCIGIEVNGLYWHSHHPKMYEYENKYKHLAKTVLSESKGIQLIHISDWEWRNKTDIVKSIIGSSLNQHSSIPGGDCDISQINKKDAALFFSENSVDGNLRADRFYALTYNTELVMVASAIITAKGYTKIVQIASAKFLKVLNGELIIFDKIKIDMNQPLILSIDRLKANHVLYEEMGLELVKVKKPSYIWTDGMNIISKSKARKISKWGSNYNHSLSISSNLYNEKYRKYWNSGALIYKF